MKLEECLPALREGKSLYNSEYHSFLTIKSEKNEITEEQDITLIDDCGCCFEFFAELFLSLKWNIVESK